MSFLIPDEFAGLSLGRSTLSAVTLKRIGGKFKLLNKIELPVEKNDALKTAADTVITSADTVLAVAAALPGAVLFSCKTLDISLDRQREALEFELPRHLAATGTSMHFGQTFTPDGEGGGTAGVLAAPGAALNSRYNALNAAGLKADVFLHPVQALPPECAKMALSLPDFAPDYYWLNGEYEHAADNSDAANLNAPLAAALEKYIDAAADDIQKFLAPILVALFCARPEFSRRVKPLLPLLPQNLRTSRCRIWIKTAVILAALLALNYGFAGIRAAARNHSAYQSVQNELDAVTGKFNALKKSVAARERGAKDIQKALDGAAAAENPAADWAMLAARLPEGTTVNYIRWNGDTVQFAIQTTADDDIPRLLANTRKNAKVTVNSQSSRGDSRMLELTMTRTENRK